MGCPCGCGACFCKSTCVCQWICNCTRCDSLRDDRCRICNRPRFQNTIPQALNISPFCNCFLSGSQVLNFERGVVRSYASSSYSDDVVSRMQHGNCQILPTASVSSLQGNAQTGEIPGYQDMIASSNMLSISDCQASGDNQGRQMLLPVITVDTQFAARQMERHDDNTATDEGFGGAYDPREFYDPAVGFFPLSPNKLSPATSKSSSHEPESTVCYSEHSSKSPPSSEHDSNPSRRLSPRTHQNAAISDRFQSELPQSLADFPHSSTESTYVMASNRPIGVPMIQIPFSALEFVQPPPPNTISPSFYTDSLPQIVRPHNVVGAASNRTIAQSFTDLSPQALRLQHVSAASIRTASPCYTDSLPQSLRPHNVDAASNRAVVPFYVSCLPQNLQAQYLVGSANRPRAFDPRLNNTERFYANPQLRASRPQPPERRHYTIKSNVESWVENIKNYDTDDDDLPKLEDCSPCSSRDSLNLDDGSQCSAETSNLDKSGLPSAEDQSKRCSDSSDLNTSTETTVHDLELSSTASCISSSACYDEARGTKRHRHGLSDSTSSSSTGIIHRSPAKRKEISTVITSSEDEPEASVEDGSGNSKDADMDTNSNVSRNPPSGEINVLSEDYVADESSDESVKD